jgi:hypothetical protein
LWRHNDEKPCSFSRNGRLGIDRRGLRARNSLFPIDTKEESLFNERLIGVWRMQESPTETKSEDGYLIFSEGKKNTYLVRGVDSKKPSGGISLIGGGKTGGLHIYRLQPARRVG